ncbi:unnamed protein product [Timema podura]|uniref:Mediator of RNA polymerase II transcription subunit 24 n=1 Tax=Timema podura TaxID=61482 RepID=A0ABN7NNJ7_TIMPD|nr:unnamed protein product [Timema podura]
MRGPLLLSMTSKTSSLKALLLRAWRERWSDLQWGIHIKTILPRGVSGDVYNLADCILQQALVGPGPNQLVVSYLKHSLSSQLVSYAAVLQRISKYDGFHKPHCIISLLEFLETIQGGITCRGKPEEGQLAASVLSIVQWLLSCLLHAIKNVSELRTDNMELTAMLDKPPTILNEMLKCDFMVAMLCLAKNECVDVYLDVVKKCQELETLLAQNLTLQTTLSVGDSLRYIIEPNLVCGGQFESIGRVTPWTIQPQKRVSLLFRKLCQLGSEKDVSSDPALDVSEPVTYCLQALLVIEVLQNPSADTQMFVNEMLMVKRLKGYSMARLHCEIMRACLISLNDVLGTSEESGWGAFVFLKIPYILRQLHHTTAGEAGEDKSVEFSQDIVDSFELLLQYTPLLDIMDARCSCNIVECLLRELAKVGLVTEPLVTLYSSKRESTSPVVPRLEQAQSQSASIPKVIIRAEPTLARILKTLDADYVKVQQEALLSVLCQVLTGKSFELILSVAIVEGKLRTFVTKLIKFNECSKQPLPGSGGETTKTSHTRAMLFDVSFLMLCSIVHTYGSEVGGAFIIVLAVVPCVPGGVSRERVHLRSSRGLVSTVSPCVTGGVSRERVHLRSSRGLVSTVSPCVTGGVSRERVHLRSSRGLVSTVSPCVTGGVSRERVHLRSSRGLVSTVSPCVTGGVSRERVHLRSSRGLVSTVSPCVTGGVSRERVVLSEEGGDSFFEQWVRECMVERGRPKCPDQMLQYCEPVKVDALLGQFNSPDNDFKTSAACLFVPACGRSWLRGSGLELVAATLGSGLVESTSGSLRCYKRGHGDELCKVAAMYVMNSVPPCSSGVKWHEVCHNVPGAIKEVLLAWEQGAVTSNDVKRILDVMRSRMCSLPVFATAWLCSYMQILHQDALLKPMNMVQQFLTPVANEESTQLDNFKERSGLMFQVIRKMQYDVFPPSQSKVKAMTLSHRCYICHSIISRQPVSSQLGDVWEGIQKRGWIHIQATHSLESLLNTSGCQWFVTNIVKVTYLIGAGLTSCHWFTTNFVKVTYLLGDVSVLCYICHSIISRQPVSSQLGDVWEGIQKRGWIHIQATHSLESLLNTSGCQWFVTNIVKVTYLIGAGLTSCHWFTTNFVKEVLNYRYQEMLEQAVDLAFGVFHLDIENCTLALLLHVLPQYLHNRLQSEELVEPQASALAKLCAYCVFAALECQNNSAPGSRKRSRRDKEPEDLEGMCPTNKLLRTAPETSEPASLFGAPHSGNSSMSSSSSANHSSPPVIIREPLQSALAELFHMLTVVDCVDSYIDLACINLYIDLSFIDSYIDLACVESYIDLACVDLYIDLACVDSYIDLACVDSYIDLACVDSYIDLSFIDSYIDLACVDSYIDLASGRDGEVSQRTHFVCKFLQFLVQCGNDRTRLVLQGMPNTMVPCLLRALPELFSTDLLLRLYDLQTVVGRKATARDLCMLRNMDLKFTSKDTV